METWAKRLKELLDAGADHGLSEVGLVKAVGAKQPSVWQWFNEPPGKTFTKMITADNAVRAASYVGTSVEYLMTGKEKNRSSQTARLDLDILSVALEVAVDSKGGVNVEKVAKAYELEFERRKRANSATITHLPPPKIGAEGGNVADTGRGRRTVSTTGRKGNR